MQTPVNAPTPILWDVVEEHLDEAAFAWTRWTSALDSPQYTLNEVAAGPERRLLAHVRGLSVGGAAVAQRLLEPELVDGADSQPERRIAALLALLAQGRLSTVQRALESRDEALSFAAERACVLFGGAELDAWVIRSLSAQRSPVRRSLLLSIGAERGVALLDLVAPLQSQESEEAAAAAFAARRADPARHRALVERLLKSAVSSVRDAALATALTWGAAAGWECCVARAADPEKPDPFAMLLSALLGGPRQHDVLLRHLARPLHRRAALYALGFTGRTAVVDALLPLLADSDRIVAKLAGEAIATIAGLEIGSAPFEGAPLPEPDVLPPLEEDDLDADLVPPIEDELPLADPAALAAHWEQRRTALDGSQRLLWGEPWSLARTVEVLSRASMRSRHPLALWLCVCTGGSAQLSTRALSRVQRAQHEEIACLSERSLLRRRYP